MTSFTDLGLRGPLGAVLDAQGIAQPFPIQALALPDALAGRDVCGKAKTGSGKTLAFGLPLLDRTQPGAKPRRPRALVLAPTRELAGQIVDVLRPLAAAVDLQVAAVYGGTSLDKDISTMKKGVEVVVATPGRLIDLVERNAVSLGEIRTLVVDEADRMADMGFMPQVEWLMRQMPKQGRQTLLFSATLDGQVNALVRHYMHDPVRHEVESDAPTVDDMTHRFFAVHQMDRVKVAAAIARGAFRTIAFVRTKRGADRLADQLSREGVKAEAIHGDLRQSARERALRRFVKGDLQVLVATDVAARGIHVDDIDVVLHFDPPEDHKGYLHRSGRTARAGRTGVVATLVLWDQRLDVERLKKRLGLHDEPIVEVFSNDPRLARLDDPGSNHKAAV
ncbi:MAG TPA: DEAD/DEAH box helicase [Acidimicrobiales bacterium]|nr:DEAD/DEAH box helicase [Acidimicrobiales bacterium]